jgi:hypothetical protein
MTVHRDYRPSAEEITAAARAEDWGEALVLGHARVVDAAICTLKEEKFVLAWDRRGRQPTDGEYLGELVAATQGLIQAAGGRKLTPSKRFVLAADILMLVHTFNGLVLETTGDGPPKDNALLCTLIEGQIGYASALLLGENFGVYDKAALYERRLAKDRRGQKGRTEKVTGWMKAALPYAVEEVGRDPSASDRHLARLIRSRFKQEFDRLPETERLTTVVAQWRKSGDLPKKKTSH